MSKSFPSIRASFEFGDVSSSTSPPPVPTITQSHPLTCTAPTTTIILSPSKKPRISHNHKVHPRAPRRNLSSFVMYANHRRQALKQQFPNLTFPELQRICSNDWKTLSQRGRIHWSGLVVEDKVRYNEQMQLWREFEDQWVWVDGYRKGLKVGMYENDEDEDGDDEMNEDDNDNDDGVEPPLRKRRKLLRSTTSLPELGVHDNGDVDDDSIHQTSLPTPANSINCVFEECDKYDCTGTEDHDIYAYLDISEDEEMKQQGHDNDEDELTQWPDADGASGCMS